MRTIQREIVGAFIFSSDNHILLGNNGPTGVYADCWVIPGGGIEEGETKIEAVKREVLEEVGIDISNDSITLLNLPLAGSSKKTLKETGETVNVDMNFHNFKVEIPLPASEVPISLNDDFNSGEWVSLENLHNKKFSPSVEAVLKHLNLL